LSAHYKARGGAAKLLLGGYSIAIVSNATLFSVQANVGVNNKTQCKNK